MYLLAEEQARRRRAYELASSDWEAARLLDIPRATLVYWRIKQGLLSRAEVAGQEQDVRRMEIYDVCERDQEAAWLLDITRESFGRWRRSRGLDAKNSTPTKENDIEFYRVWQQKASNAEMAEELATSKTTIARWQQKHGLSPKRGASPPLVRIGRSEAARRRWSAYCLSTSAREAADLAGVTESSMACWIRRSNLPPFNKAGARRRIFTAAATAGDYIARDACRRRRWG